MKVKETTSYNLLMSHFPWYNKDTAKATIGAIVHENVSQYQVVLKQLLEALPDSVFENADVKSITDDAMKLL